MSDPLLFKLHSWDCKPLKSPLILPTNCTFLLVSSPHTIQFFFSRFKRDLHSKKKSTCVKAIYLTNRRWLIPTTKSPVRISRNSVKGFFTQGCREKTSCKGIGLVRVTLEERQPISKHAFYISVTIWVKFDTAYLHIMLVNNYEFRENWCIRSRPLLNEVSRILPAFSIFFFRFS